MRQGVRRFTHLPKSSRPIVAPTALWKESAMTDRALGVGAATCKKKDCETCAEVRETKTKKKEESK